MRICDEKTNKQKTIRIKRRKCVIECHLDNYITHKLALPEDKGKL